MGWLITASHNVPS
ncbi:hypothetical protein DX882_20835 [Vibrio fluvialis]|nr:hypothetical protein [Vibrio fluvialis]TNF20402.1 MAG: hypothetical protein EP325_03185 [Vibrionaceae bacterium]EKO3971045.1 hypothetical protein [Vibrio fluvialis]EKO3981522.1 hypothetical protein [Vibrio fluvialis]EKO3987214.1 hypothetical protein [Vibrio fluvialis]